MLGIDHVGSAHDAGQLAVLLETAQARLHAGQQMLPLVDAGLAGGRPIGEPVVEGTASLIVWDALEAIYTSLGFAQIADHAFKALVLARIIEPTSKADTVRVLAELGVPGPTRVTFMRCLSDLAARPTHHRIRDSIEAHLTIVFAALAVSREAQARTGLSIKKIVQTLRPLRSATISVGQQQLTAPPRIPDPARAILSDLAQGGH